MLYMYNILIQGIVTDTYAHMEKVHFQHETK